MAIEVSTSPWHRLRVAGAFPTPPWSARVFSELRGRVPQHSLADRIVSCQARRPDDNKAVAFFARRPRYSSPKCGRKWIMAGRRDAYAIHFSFFRLVVGSPIFLFPRMKTASIYLPFFVVISFFHVARAAMYFFWGGTCCFFGCFSRGAKRAIW